MSRSHVSPATLGRLHRVRLTVVAILGVSYMLVYFHRIAPSVMAGELMRDFSISAAALGSLAAMYFYIYTVMQIPAGILADRLGVRLAAGFGVLIAGIGSIVFGLADNFYTASVGRFFVGLGVSVVFVGLMRANTVWWSESRYGFVSGVTILLGQVGAICAAAPLAAVLTVASWHTVFVAIGAFSILVAALTFGFVRNRPQDAGLPSLREMEGRPPHAESTKHWLHDLRDVLRNRAVWLGFGINFGFNGSFMVLAGLWGVPLLHDVHGLTVAEASFYSSLLLAGYAVGALTLGTYSDRMERRKPPIVGANLGLCLVWLALLLLPWGPGWSGLLLYALVGFCAGGFIVLFGSAKDVVPPATAGMAIAVVNTGAFLCAAIAQPLFGWLMDHGWNGAMVDGVRHYSEQDYSRGLWLCFGLTLLSTLVSLRMRETHCRNQAL